MTDDQFEQRLAQALREHSREVATGVDAAALASAVMSDRSAGPAWRRLLEGGGFGGTRAGFGWVALLLVLLLVAFAVVIAPGLRPPAPIVVDADRPLSTHLESPVPIDPTRPIPPALLGGWTGIDGGGAALGWGGPPSGYFADFAAPTLVVDSLGTPVSWLGRAIAYERINETRGTVTIAAPGPCDEGRYVVEQGDYIGDYILFSSAEDECAARAQVLRQGIWRPFGWDAESADVPLSGDVPLWPGRSYGSDAFGEPFHFLARHLDPPWGEAFLSADDDLGDFVLTNDPWSWEVRFIDDRPVNRDICDLGAGELGDVPATPEAVVAWLGAAPGLLASEPMEIQVDGRTGLRFDIATDQYRRCGNTRVPSIARGVTNRLGTYPMVLIYAIPSADDTILGVVTSGGSPHVLANTDGLVRSITFD